MPPVSRRQKNYDEKRRNIQNRNFFAAVFGLIAIGVAIFVVWRMIPDPPLKLLVAIKHVNYGEKSKETGSRFIPFSTESCDVVSEAFEKVVQKIIHIDSDAESYQLDANGSDLDLPTPDGVKGKDTLLIVYLNAHLGCDEDGDLYYRGPEENGDKKIPFDNILKEIAKHKAQQKILLLDAGRDSWSPVYPGRGRNEFVTKLAAKLKEDESLGDDFWLITSHDNDEISNASTPLKSSLFAYAIQESLSAIRNDGKLKDVFSAALLHKEIYKRVTAWSRNFDDISIQHPVLIHRKVGRYKLDNSEVNGSGENDSNLLVNWNPSDTEEDGNKQKPRRIDWGQFADEANLGSLLSSENFAASPHEVVRDLERFLETGILRTDVDKQQVTAYKGEIEKTLEDDPELKFNLNDIETKQAQVHKLRKRLLHAALFERLNNECLIGGFSFNSKKLFEDEVLPVSNDELKKTKNLPSKVQSFAKQVDRAFPVSKLCGQLRSRLDTKEKMTPTQAEIIGRMRKRYLPLLAAANAGQGAPDGSQDKEGNPEECDLKYPEIIDLDADENESGEGSLKEILDAVLVLPEDEDTSDTANRFRLAYLGTESVKRWVPIVPGIEWPSIEKSVRLIDGETAYEVNPFSESIPTKLELEVSGIPSFTLKIDDTFVPDGLLVGFDAKKYGKETEFKREDAVNLYVTLKDQTIRTLPPKLQPPFELSINYKGNADDIVGTLTPRIQLTEDALVTVIAERMVKLNNEPAPKRTPLYRWGTPIVEPLVIETWANARSGFKFSLTNKTKEKFHHINLYTFKKKDFGELGLRADKADEKQLKELSEYCPKIKFDDGDQLTLVARANLTGKDETEGKETLNFQALPKTDDKKDSANPPHNVTHGLMLVAFSDQEQRKPAFYQWLKFEPETAADIEVKKRTFKPSLLAIGLPDSEGERINEYIAPALSAAVIDQSSNELAQDSISFAQLKQEEALGVKLGDASELVFLDLMGVPAYEIYKPVGRSLPLEADPVRDQLCGMRIAAGDIKHHPKSWSLVTLGQDNESKSILLNVGEDEFPEDGIKTEFLLPLENNEPLQLAASDFEYEFRGKSRPLYSAYRRTHHVHATERGLLLWSDVAAHSFQLRKNDLDQEISVGRVGKSNLLGKWKFITESNKSQKPTIKLGKSSVFKSEARNVQVTVDLSDIETLVDLDGVELSLKDKPLQDSATFLREHPHPDRKNQFQFELGDLAGKLGRTPAGRMTVQVKVTDFFGSESDDSDSIQIEKSAQIRKKSTPPPPKPVTVEITFIGSDGEPAEIFKLDQTIIVNNKSLTFGTPKDLGNGTGIVLPRREDGGKKVVLKGLVPNKKYSVEVRGRVRRPGQAQFINQVAKKSFQVSSEEAKIELKLEFK